MPQKISECVFACLWFLYILCSSFTVFSDVFVLHCCCASVCVWYGMDGVDQNIMKLFDCAECVLYCSQLWIQRFHFVPPQFHYIMHLCTHMYTENIADGNNGPLVSPGVLRLCISQCSLFMLVISHTRAVWSERKNSNSCQDATLTLATHIQRGVFCQFVTWKHLVMINIILYII